MTSTHDPHLLADVLRVLVIAGCVLQGFLSAKSGRVIGTLGAHMTAFGALMIDIFIGGTETLRFGHDIGYWRLYVGFLGIYALNLGYWFRIREMQREQTSVSEL